MLIAVLALLGAAPAHASTGLELARPVEGSVVRAFDAPANRYAAGHRGVDMAPGDALTVRAAAQGRVLHAGHVAGTPSVSIDHGNGWRTTYMPVVATVAEGDVVRSGQVVGTLSSGHCGPTACLHWGLTDGETYLDPTAYLSVPTVRLLPRGSVPLPLPFLPAAAIPGPAGAPVAGTMTSPFGMRRHPVTGVMKLHDGVDYAAACGTPVTAPSAGRVLSAAFDGAYGYRVRVDHGGGLTMGYAHLQGLSVSAGQALAAGAVVGSVGDSGLSTGCHLHWMAWRDGALVDPTTLR